MSNGSEKDQSVKHVDWEKEEFVPLDTKRPTIPEKVAEYIDTHKKDFSTLFRAFDKANNYVREWLASDNENMQTFGYTITEDTKYIVRVTVGYGSGDCYVAYNNELKVYYLTIDSLEAVQLSFDIAEKNCSFIQDGL